MNEVVVEDVRNNLKLSIYNAVHKLSQLLVSTFKTCAESKLERIRVGIEELASYAGKMNLQSRDAEALPDLFHLKCDRNRTMEYQEHHSLEQTRTFRRRMNYDALLIAEKIADSLDDVMVMTTIDLWKSHEDKDGSR